MGLAEQTCGASTQRPVSLQIETIGGARWTESGIRELVAAGRHYVCVDTLLISRRIRETGRAFALTVESEHAVPASGAARFSGCSGNWRERIRTPIRFGATAPGAETFAPWWVSLGSGRERRALFVGWTR